MFRQRSAPAARRTAFVERTSRSRVVLLLGGALCLATAALLWLGYQATAEWSRSEVQLADKRASEKLALLMAAVDRDMKGAQLSVLVPINQEQLGGSGPGALSALFARAFARFPYPESFFVWSDPQPGLGATYLFHRADRLPSWDARTDAATRYPVVTRRDRTVLHPVIERIRRDATHRRRFAAYEFEIAGVPYQLVVHLLYDDITGAGRLFGAVGYTVNLAWVDQEYFKELIRQVSQIGGDADATLLHITKLMPSERQQSVAAPGAHARRFPLHFFDRNLTLISEGKPAQWIAQVTPSPGGGESRILSGQRMFGLMALAALAAISSVVVIARGLVVTSELAAMKSEFVSTVTHELKTPLSLMRLVADTLVTGRYKSPETILEYGQLLSGEVSRMTRLIDNLLWFARLNRVDHFYAPAVLDMAELLEEAAADFRPRLVQLGFSLTMEVGSDPLVVRADRTSLLLALDNLLDNAIKYSPENGERSIILRGLAEGGMVVVEVEDHGSGIHEDDLPQVQEKFFRGRQAGGDGSGLGLAIVTKIVRDHRGRVDIRSSLAAGTTVRISLPGTRPASSPRHQA